MLIYSVRFLSMGDDPTLPKPTQPENKGTKPKNNDRFVQAAFPSFNSIVILTFDTGKKAILEHEPSSPLHAKTFLRYYTHKILLLFNHQINTCFYLQIPYSFSDCILLCQTMPTSALYTRPNGGIRSVADESVSSNSQYQRFLPRLPPIC